MISKRILIFLVSLFCGFISGFLIFVNSQCFDLISQIIVFHGEPVSLTHKPIQRKGNSTIKDLLPLRR